MALHRKSTTTSNSTRPLAGEFRRSQIFTQQITATVETYRIVVTDQRFGDTSDYKSE